MSVDLVFLRFRNGEPAKPDAAGIELFLNERGLTLRGETFVSTSDGQPLSFQGRTASVDMSGIARPTCAQDEMDFVLGLCLAGGFLIVHGGPGFLIVPGANHRPEDFAPLTGGMPYCVVHTTEDLGDAICEGCSGSVQLHEP